NPGLAPLHNRDLPCIVHGQAVLEPSTTRLAVFRANRLIHRTEELDKQVRFRQVGLKCAAEFQFAVRIRPFDRKNARAKVTQISTNELPLVVHVLLFFSKRHRLAVEELLLLLRVSTHLLKHVLDFLGDNLQLRGILWGSWSKFYGYLSLHDVKLVSL